MRLKSPVSFARVAEICRPLLAPGADKELPQGDFESLDSPDLSTPRSLAFLAGNAPLRLRRDLRAALVLSETPLHGRSPALCVSSMHRALELVLTELADNLDWEVPGAPDPCAKNRVHAAAVVEGILEGDVEVGPGCFVGPGSHIGSGAVLDPNVTVHANCRIGRGCRLQAGAVVGGAGFGFYRWQGRLRPVPHPAGAILEDDVWLGANAVVAGGVLNPTRVGRGSRLDNHVQVAHNVRLGEGAVLAAFAAIAGSTVIGPGLKMGGGSAIAGHLRIGREVTVAAFSAVTKDMPDGAVLAGFPAKPIREWRRQQVLLGGLARRGRA